MQEIDAERRIQQLRGIKIDPLPTPAEEEEDQTQARQNGLGRERKRRRIVGEDDTDRDIRFARENDAVAFAKADLQLKSTKTSNAPITDRDGHINLFPMEGPNRKASKNAEEEAEKAKKQKEYEDQYTMRFSNAAGFKQAIGQEPWYHTLSKNGEKDHEVETPSKDVWGNEDPRRKERERMRIAADDPLAAIQKGVTGVREVEKERKRWKEEKEREIREIEEADRRHDRKRRRRRKEKDLENFSLDVPLQDDSHKHHHRRERDDSDRKNHHTSHSHEPTRHRSHHHHHHHRRRLEEKFTPGWEVGPGGRYSSQFAQA